MNIYMYTYVHVIAINEKRVQEFEKQQMKFMGGFGESKGRQK